jgi:phosphoribosylformylglycinamidine synthase
VTLWEVDIYPRQGQPDLAAKFISADAADMGLCEHLELATARGFLVQGDLDESQMLKLSDELFADRVVERTVTAAAGDPQLAAPPNGKPHLVYVLPKPGVMDPVAQSAQKAIADLGLNADSVRTFKKYWLAGVDSDQLDQLCRRVLANDSIEQVVVGPLPFDHLQVGDAYTFEKITVAIRELDDAGLEKVSREGQLYLTLVEMQTIQQHFQDLGRDPTDAELESVAQTWSEHCSHKTLAGRIAYRDERGERRFENMLKETIFEATEKIRARLGEDDWCVSVFRDNAGVVRFDDEHNVVFKVETHNHPSALEPYGGANTGIGGVIRDPLGTGMGAKPICNTDVFCFAPPDTPNSEIPDGVLHPRRVMKGVVSGVRDYGNRMGIPTVNGALYFDRRYLGNPLVYCGNVGLLPVDKTEKQPQANDFIVALGGRTGRDGIHGATFSSAELTSESESLSGGAVQIGNAITEKMLLDVLLEARDKNLYTAVTDCGAGGFSSAVGEMGEEIGAEVWLDKAPLKYDGLNYAEIWISEAQERMVLSVSPEKWEAFRDLCAAEDVEATVIGQFKPTNRLKLIYHGEEVADLSMEFLHNGRPPIVRDAEYKPVEPTPLEPLATDLDPADALLAILGSLNVCSKEWVIRQYDHEVQGGSAVKPLVGIENDGPGDAAVVRPVLGSRRALAISCGMNPCYGELDTYRMAASAIDEAIRNCVAVGADPSRIAVLDNFCWGYTDRPSTLGSLVRAALACHDVAVDYETPFISGKDSLNNEFSYQTESGKQTIEIPPSLLISAMGQVEDVGNCTTMDLKGSGHLIYQLGVTRSEMGGSHYGQVTQRGGGAAPGLDTLSAKKSYERLHNAMVGGLVRSCHDLSEGGLAVAVAEMAFSGGIGVEIHLSQVPYQPDDSLQTDELVELLFAESNARLLCEVAREHAADFESAMADSVWARIGQTTDSGVVTFRRDNDAVIELPLGQLKEAWQAPLRW